MRTHFVLALSMVLVACGSAHSQDPASPDISSDAKVKAIATALPTATPTVAPTETPAPLPAELDPANLGPAGVCFQKYISNTSIDIDHCTVWCFGSPRTMATQSDLNGCFTFESKVNYWCYWYQDECTRTQNPVTFTGNWGATGE